MGSGHEKAVCPPGYKEEALCDHFCTSQTGSLIFLQKGHPKTKRACLYRILTSVGPVAQTPAEGFGGLFPACAQSSHHSLTRGKAAVSRARRGPQTLNLKQKSEF